MPQLQAPLVDGGRVAAAQLLHLLCAAVRVGGGEEGARADVSGSRAAQDRRPTDGREDRRGGGGGGGGGVARGVAAATKVGAILSNNASTSDGGVETRVNILLPTN